jgi:hypothetical protein
MMLMNRRHRHFNPASAGATLALDARDASRSYADGAAVTTWTGKAGSATGTVPTMDVDGLNGLPAVSFPGTGAMSHSVSGVAGPYAWIVALQITGSLSGYRGIAAATDTTAVGSMILSNALIDNVWGSYAGPGNPANANSTLASGDKVILSMIDEAAGGGAFFRNGATDGTWTGNSFGQSSHIGGDSGQETPMKLGAVVLLLSSISAALRRRIEQSLAFSFRIACA